MSQVGKINLSKISSLPSAILIFSACERAIESDGSYQIPEIKSSYFPLLCVCKNS